MMLNRRIVKKRTPQKAMILGILENCQKDPNQLVEHGHQGVHVILQYRNQLEIDLIMYTHKK
jgi:hypothetical protein